MGYMVGYEPYMTKYLIWYLGSCQIKKARDLIFHKHVIVHATPTLYGDNDTPQDISTSSMPSKITKNKPSPIPATQPHLFICIPAHPKPTVHGPEDQYHATIKEVPLDQQQQDKFKLISNIPDYTQGMMHSRKQHGKIQALVASEDLEETIIMSANISGEPTNIKDALNLPGKEGEAWECGHQLEWQNMITHNVFGPLEQLPPDMQILKMGTTLQTKKKDGQIISCKVCIVAKRYSQVPGLHFNETFAPIMHWELLKAILTLGAITNLGIHQFDVKSAYLHRIIQEEIWIQQPEGFEVPGKEHLALRLKKVLYGTKQGGNQWRKTLENFMQEKLNWQCSDYDWAIFYKSWNNGTWAIVGFWIDDATSIGHQQHLLELEDVLKEWFSLSDECHISWILGTAITRNMDQNLISKSQRNYIEDIATKFHIGTSMTYKLLSPSA